MAVCDTVGMGIGPAAAPIAIVWSWLIASALARERLTLADTEALVKADLAARLKVEESEVRIVESKEKTWPDANLGCGGRKGVVEPAPVEGFEVTAASGDRKFSYHTDRSGRLVRCDPPAKPLAPIRR